MSKDIFNDKFLVSYNDGEGFYCAYPLAISIIDNQKRQTNLRILLSEINSMVQCLSAPFSPPVRLATMTGDYTLEWLVNDREVAFIHTGTKQAVVLSEAEAQGLVSLVIQKMSSKTPSPIQKPQPAPSLSSSQTNSQPADNTQFCVIFDDHGEYPLHIMIVTDSSLVELHIRLDEVNDFVHCLSVPGCDDVGLHTREGLFKLFWYFPLKKIGIVNITKGPWADAIRIMDFRALELVELIKSKMSGTHETQELDIDPLAGARKRMDDNLSSVFG
jgi:hypothetical protein